MRLIPPVVRLVLGSLLCFHCPVYAQSEVETSVIEDDATLDSALSSDAANEAPSPVETEMPEPELPTPSAYSESAPAATQAAGEAEEATLEEATLEEATAEEAASSETAATQEQGQSQSQGEEEDKTQTAETVTTPETAVEVQSSKLSDDGERERQIYGSRLFGSQKVQLAVNRPTFTENASLREKLYGKPKDYATVTGDWFPLDWWVNPGLTFRIGGYSASGKAARGNPTKEQIERGDIQLDESSKTTLLFIPLMLGAKVEMTPFSRKWIVLEGWAGYEYGWWQETRDTTTTASTTLAEAEDEPVRTSKGTKSAIVMGGSANFLLNWLDERSVRSMVDTMGISAVYLSPFFEIVKSTTTEGMTFSRNTIGLGFTFESFK